MANELLCRIAVVDDSAYDRSGVAAAIRDSARAFGTEEVLQVEEHGDARLVAQRIEEAEVPPWEIILADVLMPNLENGGLLIADAVRARYEERPVAVKVALITSAPGIVAASGRLDALLTSDTAPWLTYAVKAATVTERRTDPHLAGTGAWLRTLHQLIALRRSEQWGMQPLYAPDIRHMAEAVFRSSASLDILSRAALIGGNELVPLVTLVGPPGAGQQLVAQLIHYHRAHIRGVAERLRFIPPSRLVPDAPRNIAVAFGFIYSGDSWVAQRIGVNVFADGIETLSNWQQESLAERLEQITTLSDEPRSGRVLLLLGVTDDRQKDVGIDTLAPRLAHVLKERSAIVTVPPLRERRDDIVPVATAFFRQIRDANSTTLLPDAEEWLLDPRRVWSRGFDSLRAIIWHASEYGQRRTLSSDDLERAATTLLDETSRVALSGPDLADYDPREQPWYPNRQPEVIGLSREEIKRSVERIDVLLMTANIHEKAATLRLMTPAPPRRKIARVRDGADTYYVGRLGVHAVALVMTTTGTGGRDASLAVGTMAMAHWEPRAVIALGVAFGAHPSKQTIADVLISDQIIAYEPQRISRAIIPRGPQPSSGPTLFNRFRDASDWRFARPDGTTVERREGAVLSGEKLVANRTFVEELLTRYPQAIGGEMEGFGVFGSADRAKREWIVVKAICDWGDLAKGDKHQPLAAAAAASLVKHVLSDRHALDGL